MAKKTAARKSSRTASIQTVEGDETLGNQLAELRDRSVQIGLHHLCTREPPSTLPRVEPVTDGVGEIASFCGNRACGDRVTCDEGHMSLPAEDLTQPPPVTQCAG